MGDVSAVTWHTPSNGNSSEWNHVSLYLATIYKNYLQDTSEPIKGAYVTAPANPDVDATIQPVGTSYCGEVHIASGTVSTVAALSMDEGGQRGPFEGELQKSPTGLYVAIGRLIAR